MPYITGKRRYPVLNGDGPNVAGELNFKFTVAITSYLERHGENYQTYNDIFGALIGALLELYRRKAAPYEDKKIIENGDVY